MSSGGLYSFDEEQLRSVRPTEVPIHGTILVGKIETVFQAASSYSLRSRTTHDM